MRRSRKSETPQKGVREFESHRFRQFIINRFMRDIIKLLDQIEEGSTPGFTIGSTIHSLLKGNGPNPGQNGKSNIVSVTQPSLGSIEIQIEYVDPSSIKMYSRQIRFRWNRNAIYSIRWAFQTLELDSVRVWRNGKPRET